MFFRFVLSSARKRDRGEYVAGVDVEALALHLERRVMIGAKSPSSPALSALAVI
jgi:hypothetical protein